MSELGDRICVAVRALATDSSVAVTLSSRGLDGHVRADVIDATGTTMLGTAPIFVLNF